MKLVVFSILLLGVFPQTNAQEFVVLRGVPFTVTTQNIHITGVLDTREKKHLGIQKNLNGNKVKLQLNKGLANSILNFYNLSLPLNENSQPIYIEVKALNVQASKRRMNNGIVNIARAHVALVFFEKQETGFKEIFAIQHNEDEVFGLTDRQGLYGSHEKRIRAALEYCMHAFLNNYNKQNSSKTHHFKLPKEGYKIDNKLGQWFNLVTVKGMRSTYFEGYGISYTGFVDSKKGFIRPYETSFEVMWARPGVATENGYNDVNSFVFRPELYFFYKRLFKGVYASISANIPIGYETLENLDGSNSFNFVIGAGASQGLRIIPWEKQGIVLGIDFFQQFETSKVYRTDLGVELVLGINF